MRIVITSLPDIVNLRLLLPRNDFWLRRRILSRIRRRDSRSLQFYWWESLLGLLFVFNALKIQTSLLTPTSFCPFSYVELTLRMGGRHENQADLPTALFSEFKPDWAAVEVPPKEDHQHEVLSNKTWISRRGAQILWQHRVLSERDASRF